MTTILIPNWRRWESRLWGPHRAPRRLRGGHRITRQIFRCGRTGHTMDHNTRSCSRCGAVYQSIRGHRSWVEVL